MIPTPPTKRAVAVYDTECYPNYWLLKFRIKDGPTFTYKIMDGQSFDDAAISSMRFLFDNFTTVSFNGNGYDVAMIGAALIGYSTQQLKWLNDQIIVEKRKPWQLGLPEWKPADHIDVMEPAPGAGSLKQYAARIHSKRLRDLPYDPGEYLTAPQMHEVDVYCENDLDDLDDLYNELRPQLKMRAILSERYGFDLRSKSDAQLAEAVLKYRCEQVRGIRLYKNDVDWNFRFRYKVPDFISFATPQLQNVLRVVRDAVFGINAKGSVGMPEQLEGLTVTINQTAYKMGIGGLHSQESCVAHYSTDDVVLLDNDVESYYPSMIINGGDYPPALGEAFLQEFTALKTERLSAKALQAKLKKSGDTSSVQYENVEVGNEGGKVMINGTFGKTASQYSILFAPTMLIQTTLTGQLALLMLIEWHEHYGIPVVSANTDGIVTKCPRDKVHVSKALIAEWETRTNLKMESVEYRAIYSRDVNNYIAIKSDGEAKRKGEYAKSGLIAKKNPDVEICADAVVDYLTQGVPLEYTIAMCRDIRKFITVQKVAGGGVKMWGEGVRKGTKVRDIIPIIQAAGWLRVGRKWRRGDIETDASTAYAACFAPQRPEYLGKVVRWYYATNAPGSILYASNGNTVSLSYGAFPCMILPDIFPDNIDYGWYVNKANEMLRDMGAS